jgi:hypothetical protein
VKRRKPGIDAKITKGCVSSVPVALVENKRVLVDVLSDSSILVDFCTELVRAEHLNKLEQ